MNEKIQKLIEDSFKFEFIKGVVEFPYPSHEFDEWRVLPWLILVYSTEKEYYATIKEQETFCANASEMVMIPSGTPHKLKFPEKGNLSVMHIQYTILGGIDLLSFFKIPNHVKKEQAETLHQSLIQLSDLYANPYFSIRMAADKHYFASRLLMSILELADLDTGKANRLNKIQRLEPTLNYIEKNFEKGISRNQLSEIACLSPARLNTVFTEVMGIPPMKYVRQLRLQRAMALLRNAQLTIEQVADILNFCDPFHFSKQFKQETGFSPIHYRKNLQNSFDTLITT